MNDYQIKLRYYVQFYLTTFIMILVLNSKDAGIITFFVVGGIFVLLNYIILLEFCKNLVTLLKRRQESK